LWRFESLKFAGIADVTFNKIEFDPTIAFGKQPAIS
jgi:hypothetical protein